MTKGIHSRLYIWRLDSRIYMEQKGEEKLPCGVFFWFHKCPMEWGWGGRLLVTNIISYRGRIIVWDHQGGSYKKRHVIHSCHSWNCSCTDHSPGFFQLIFNSLKPSRVSSSLRRLLSLSLSSLIGRDRRKDIEESRALYHVTLYQGNIKGVSWIYSHNERRT